MCSKCAKELLDIADFVDEAANIESEDESPVRALVDKFRERAEFLRDLADQMDPYAGRVEQSQLKVEVP